MCVDLCELVCACLSDTDNVCVSVGDFFNIAMLTEAPEKKKTGIGSAKSKIRIPSRTYRGVRISEISCGNQAAKKRRETHEQTSLSLACCQT